MRNAHKSIILYFVVLILVSKICNGAPDAEISNNKKVIKDNEAYSSGSYLAYIAPFNKDRYIGGRDYTENIALSPADFPNKSLFSWNWPHVTTDKGVYNFSAIDYGDYDNTVVKVPINPKKIGDILTLSETHDASYLGELQNYDVIDDLFLTTAPGNNATNVFEIEIFTHTPGYSASYVRGARRIGKFVGSGASWLVTIDASAPNSPDILFMPENEADIAKGTIDIKAMLTFLVNAGALPSTVYFNGLAFGTETHQGSGMVNLMSFSVDYK